MLAVSTVTSIALVVGLSISNAVVTGALGDRTEALRQLQEQQRVTKRALTAKETALGGKERALDERRQALNSLGTANEELKAKGESLETKQRSLYLSLLQLSHQQAIGNNVALVLCHG